MICSIWWVFDRSSGHWICKTTIHGQVTMEKCYMSSSLWSNSENGTIFAIFHHFYETLYPRKVSKPQNCEIKYPQNYVPAKFEALFFLLFDQSIISIPVYRISLFILMKLGFLWHIWKQFYWLTIEKLLFNETFVSYFYWNREIKYPWNILQSPNREIKSFMTEAVII